VNRGGEVIHMSLSQDPIHNTINENIRRSITVAIDNECFPAAVILIFAGIDAMAHLGRPEGKLVGGADDFKNWVDRYFVIRAPTTTITPEEWWEARNAIIHTYGTYSRAHRVTGGRVLTWQVEGRPRVRYNPAVSTDMAIVDILLMRDTFFEGLERFLIEGFASAARRPLLEARLNEMLQSNPYREEDNDEEVT
jgi:hypothetical protein